MSNFAIGKDGRSLDINSQSQTETLFQYFLMEELKLDITLTSDASIDDTVLNISTGHGFTGTSGEMLVIRNGDLFEQVDVVSATSNTVTIKLPLPADFPATTTKIMRGNKLLNVNASPGSPQIFKCGIEFATSAGAQIPIDITGAVFHLLTQDEPDDTTFGGIAELTNGFYFRKVDGNTINLGNFTNNGKFREYGAILQYEQKGGGTDYSVTAYFDIDNLFGQAIRLKPLENDCLHGVVRDNISDGGKNSYFTISILGYYADNQK